MVDLAQSANGAGVGGIAVFDKGVHAPGEDRGDAIGFGEVVLGLGILDEGLRDNHSVVACASIAKALDGVLWSQRSEAAVQKAGFDGGFAGWPPIARSRAPRQWRC